MKFPFIIILIICIYALGIWVGRFTAKENICENTEIQLQQEANALQAEAIKQEYCLTICAPYFEEEAKRDCIDACMGGYEEPLILMNGLFIVARVSTPVGEQVLGSLTNMVDEIIRRESGGDPKICNLQHGCSHGISLCGFISSTWNDTLDRMNCAGKWDTEKCVKSYLPERCSQKVYLPVSEERTEMIFEPVCHRLVCEWLYEEDGIRHWESEDGSWGSGPYPQK